MFNQSGVYPSGTKLEVIMAIDSKTRWELKAYLTVIGKYIDDENYQGAVLLLQDLVGELEKEVKT